MSPRPKTHNPMDEHANADAMDLYWIQIAVKASESLHLFSNDDLYRRGDGARCTESVRRLVAKGWLVEVPGAALDKARMRITYQGWRDGIGRVPPWVSP